MQDWYLGFLQAGAENRATEWILPLDKPAGLRIDGRLHDVDLTAGPDAFLALMQEILPHKQLKHFEDDDGNDFIEENFLFYVDGLERFLGTLQRQRGQLAFVARHPHRGPSVLFDILKWCVDHEASDMHVREGKFVRTRIHSQLEETDFFVDTELFKKSMTEILPEGRLKIFEEDGDLDFAWEEEGIGRFRVNLHRTRGIHAYTFRHVKSKAPTVKEIGMPDILKTIADSRNGIIFVTGTTGSGKSTTMAAMLDHINNSSDRHIITIEDPIEYTFQDNRCFFEQREVGLDVISFESALIHALRQDPDIIMVGEMRNRTTFETAMTAAATGHMVISTLHTKNAHQSLSRILDMFPMEERDNVRKDMSECLRAIICQRLAPRAGGNGVVPITEIMINTPIVRKLIFENKIDKLPQAIAGGEKEGMMSFNQCLLKLVNNGDITEEVAMQFSDNPQGLRMNLKGIFLSEDGSLVQ